VKEESQPQGLTAGVEMAALLVVMHKDKAAAVVGTLGYCVHQQF
jgi:hypothetical protein